MALAMGVGNLGRAILSITGTSRAAASISWASSRLRPFQDRRNHAWPGSALLQTISGEHVIHDNIEIGIITTPPERAQRAALHMVEAGLTSILNFAPARINVPDHVRNVEYVDFFRHLYTLAFDQSHGHEEVSLE